ncbi:Fe-S cluster assembly sulfur transfer protein SufU [Lichenicoccus sp.]|uniref:Fe-S cluster assembly sulfur transfer protein SufU n=1 Tax=Lichenicoccus sp. TaxID=2781899 RepID=UPI003D0EF4A0
MQAPLSQDMAALYQEMIVDRARAPRHAGVLEPADGAADGDNPFCGDRVHVTLRLAPQGGVAELRHRTRGCAICMASADLMADAVDGLQRPAIVSLYERFGAMLRDGRSDSGDDMPGRLGLLTAFETLHEYRSRIRCATLPWTALLDAMAGPPGKDG